MGILSFFFNKAEWELLYPDKCASKSMEEWKLEAEPNIPIGILYLSAGIICEIVYIPIMIAMSQPEFLKHSCYKFMFLLGIIDMLTLPFNGILSGIQSILGLHFCSDTTLFYFLGLLAMANYYGGNMTCILLAINRFVEMCLPAKVAVKLYDGYRIYIWLSIPILEIICINLFEIPAFYSPKMHAWFYDPFNIVDSLSHPTMYTNYFHIVHNSLTMLVMGVCYFILTIYMCVKYRVYHIEHVCKLQKLMNIQAVIICSEMFLAAGLCIVMQHVELPIIVTTISHCGWILVNGDTPFFYLILNASLRKSVLQMVNSVWITVQRSFWITLQRSSSSFVKVAPMQTPDERIASSIKNVTSSYNQN